jgi:uncharacterized alpha-E superfamily protein
MQSPQIIFNQIEKNKKQLKEIKKEFKSRYEEIGEYNELNEQKRAINEKIKQIRSRVHEANYELYTKMEDLKIDIASDKEMLTDLMLVSYVKGEQVQLQNEYKQDVLPIFSLLLKTS